MNIFFCASTSQLFTVDKVMDVLPDTDKHIVVFMYTPNINREKAMYYSDKVKNRCHSFIFLDFYFSTLITTYIKLLWLTLFRKKIFFVANWSIAEFRILARFLNIKEIRTFDDGAANLVITREGMDERAPNSIRVKYLLKWSKWTPQYLMDNSKAHYSFFSHIPQIMKNLIPISVMGKTPSVVSQQDICPNRILLGQPVTEFVKTDNPAAYVEQVIKDKNIDYYFPHPREEFEISDKSKVVKSPLLFEDYFAEFLSDKPCVIYTFFSTTIVSLYNLPNVKAIVLRPHNLIPAKRWTDTYEMLASLGIETEILY